MDEDGEEEARSVGEIVDKLDGLTGREVLCVRDVVEDFGRSSFVPMLIVPALVVVSPLSGVPGLSSIFGLIIATISAQMVARREYIWLPGPIMRLTIRGERLHAALRKIRSWVDWLDEHAARRLEFLTRPPVNIVPRLCCMLAGLAMPFLELVPFSSSILALSVILFAVGFLTRDGLFTVLGFLVLAGAAAVPFFAVSAMSE